jgi:hypothetical protein
MGNRPQPLTVTLSPDADGQVTHIASVRGTTREDVAAQLIADELGRNVYDALYGRADYAATLSGLAARFAELLRDLLALPQHEAAEIVAMAAAERFRPSDTVSGHSQEMYDAMLQSIVRNWLQRETVEHGPRPGGDWGPLTDTRVHAPITPEGHDALRRIAHALGGLSVREAAGKALAAGLPVLDPGPATDETTVTDGQPARR